MATAKKVGDQWSVLAYLGKDEKGKKIYKRVSGSSKKAVELEAAQLAVKSKNKNPNEKTVGQIIEEYIELKSNILSPSTLKSYRSLLKYHFEDIKDIDISDLTQTDIQHMINAEALDKSSKTVRNMYGLLTASINEFYPNLHYRIKLPQKQKTNMQIPDSDAIKRYLEMSKGTEIHKAVVLGAFLGLRRSEVCALTKKDIDFKTNTVRINKALVIDNDRNAIIKHPKSYAGNRTIVMPKIVADTLKTVDTDKVVNLSLHQITHHFRALNKELGYSFRFHDLRHYNASVMLLLNVPDKYAQERIGHATNSMLKDVYQHTFSKKHLEIAEQMNTYFEEIYSSDNKTDNKKP